MALRNNKTSRRAKSISEKISSIETIRSEMLDPALTKSERKDIHKQITKEINTIKSRLNGFQKQIDADYYKTNEEDEKPVLDSTTLWDFPTQNYGTSKKGNSKFQGVTPAFIIYNMIQRYTSPGDLQGNRILL